MGVVVQVFEILLNFYGILFVKLQCGSVLFLSNSMSLNLVFYRAMSGLTRRAVNGDFGGAGLYSPHKRGGDGSQAPLFGSGRGDEAVAPGDEREMIQAEIDT